MADDKVVSSFKRNPTEEVRATLKEFRGKRYLDLRIYYQDEAGEWKPTRKGVSLSTDFMPELKEAVMSLERALKVEDEEGADEEAPKPPAAE